MTWKRQCGDILQGTELQNLVERFNGNGVLSGLAITASGIPDMETHVASGSWFAGETKQTDERNGNGHNPYSCRRIQ